MMKRYLLILAALLVSSCTVPPPVIVPPPPVTTSVSFDIGVCKDAIVFNYCNGPSTPEVTITPIGVLDSPRVQIGDANGYLYVPLIPPTWKVVQIDITAQGYKTFTAIVPVSSLLATNATCDTGVCEHNFFTLRSALPEPPSRDELIHPKITFQGLIVNCPPYGDLPWFEAVLPWASNDCRTNAYFAKHHSTAWDGGDTHAIVALPSGAPLYDEANQPYSADRFGALDWASGNTFVDHRLPDLVTEVITNGFRDVLVFLGGDNGQAGYAVATKQLPLVIDALKNASAGDLMQYSCIVPGWDGVWHKPGSDGTGWTPEQIAAFGQLFRSLYPNGCLALEHAIGYIPVGEGDSDFLPGGRLSTYDLILSEFDGPRDSAWRQTRISDPQGRVNYNGNQIWQIAARLNPTWIRPNDEPADADSSKPPYVMKSGTPRGPYSNCAFEWVGEYRFVRGDETAEQVNADRNYFKSIGYTCGG